MENTKSVFQSKRFWSGVIAIITSLSLVITGEKTFNQLLPEIILTLVGIAQMFFGITSNTELTFGRKVLGRKY
jgi:uncharacterized membrane protein